MTEAEHEMYLAIRHNDDIYYIWTDSTAKCCEVKRQLARYTGKRICDMRLVIPRLSNSIFADNHTVKDEVLQNGEKLFVRYRIPETGKFEGEEVRPDALFSDSNNDSDYSF